MIARIFLILFLGALLGACGTTPKKSGDVAVEDRSTAIDADIDTDTPDTGEGAQSFGMEDAETATLSQLEDPANLLSVRIIYFDYDSNAILPQFNEAIQAHASFLQANPGIAMTLEGHADERGSREYNLALGERRALAVEKQLVILGAAPAQIRTVSYGEERPAADGHDQEAWALNRRVEFVY